MLQRERDSKIILTAKVVMKSMDLLKKMLKFNGNLLSKFLTRQNIIKRVKWIMYLNSERQFLSIEDQQSGLNI